MKYIFSLICFILLTSLSTCNWLAEDFSPENVIITIYNYGKEEITVMDDVVPSYDSVFTVSDALKQNSYNHHKIKCNRLANLEIPKTFLVDIFTDSTTFTYHILLFKKSTIEKYSKEDLIEKNIYDLYRTYTYEDLKAFDFKLYYDGNELTSAAP